MAKRTADVRSEYVFQGTVKDAHVVLTDTYTKCGHLPCGVMFPVQLRRTADTIIRNQPQCGPCRGKSVEQKKKELLEWEKKNGLAPRAEA